MAPSFAHFSPFFLVFQHHALPRSPVLRFLCLFPDVSALSSLASMVNSSNAAALGGIAAADLGLELVQLLRGAMQSADVSVAAQAHNDPTIQPTCHDNFVASDPPVKVVYSAPHVPVRPIPMTYIPPDKGLALPKQFCDTDPPIPAAPVAASVSPFQPPWKSLPWPKQPMIVAAAVPQLIIRQVSSDHTGMMLDMFA
jgi:hypothetical protein